jgi:AbrB family looped-hinge helix DNA binding protein
MQEVFRAKINDEGRLVIPASCRKKLGLVQGQELLVRLNEDGLGLQLMTLESAAKRFQAEVRSLAGPNVSLVDELLTERRAEAAKEAGE